MLNHIKVTLAGLNIDIEYKHAKIAFLCRNYLSEFEKPDISVNFDEAAVEKEAVESGLGGISAEFTNIYRQIAEKLPEFSRVVAHGATISYDKYGYMFIAPSGTGKTTHINLWRKYFEGVDIINGDKPVLEVKENFVYAYGTPWAGKEMYEKNTSAPLKAITVIKRANENSIRRISSSEALNALMKQVYLPENDVALDLTIQLFDDIIRLVPFYELSCDISREAALCSFEVLTSKKRT